MKADPTLRRVPVAISTVAQIEEYDARAYDEGACEIVSKPIDSKCAERQIEAILSYFAWANPSPPHEEAG